MRRSKDRGMLSHMARRAAVSGGLPMRVASPSRRLRAMKFPAWLVAVAAAPAVFLLLRRAAAFVFDRWLFGGLQLNHAPRFDSASGRWTFRNWGGNQSFTPADVAAPG